MSKAMGIRLYNEQAFHAQIHGIKGMPFKQSKETGESTAIEFSDKQQAAMDQMLKRQQALKAEQAKRRING